MAFNNQTHTSFFTNAPQMALTNDQRVRLAAEGLATVEDFADFKEDQLTQAIRNLRTPIPGVAAVIDAAGVIVNPAIPAIPPCLISAKCSLRLNVASLAYHYYFSIDRERNPVNMNYSTVLRGFHIEWEALITMSKEDKPDVPALSKHVTPIKWVESFKDCLFRTYGVRVCPLLYVIRESIAVTPEVDDPLETGKSYGSSGSVLDELISRLSHTDPLFKSDNAMVYSMLEEATRSTIYAPTVKPFARTKNGRAAYLAMISSHAGQDKWEKMQKDKTKFLMNTKWNGRQYSLEKFTNLHRSSYVQLEEAQIHVNFQLPTEHTRVGYLLENLNNNDPDLRAAIASVRINTNNMRSDFEAAVAFLLPVCPYMKHRSSNSGENRANISDATLKGKHHSKTGVDFRWHTKQEYSKLTKPQRKELYEWQRSKDGKEKMKTEKPSGSNHSSNSAGSNSMTKKQLLAKVKSLEASVQEGNAGTQLDEITAIISSVVNKTMPEPKPPAKPKVSLPPPATHKAAALAIQGILKRKRADEENE